MKYSSSNFPQAGGLRSNGMVGYPIENHVYQLGEDVLKSFVSDLVAIIKDEGSKPNDFKDFLVRRFGQTLYDLYFGPYNTKVWRRDLSDVPHRDLIIDE